MAHLPRLSRASLPFSFSRAGLALSLSLGVAGLAGAQQLPGEDPLWPKELREEGRQAGELRRLRELAREREAELERLRAQEQEAPTSRPAREEAEAELVRLRAELDRLQAEVERLRAAPVAPAAPLAPALAPAAPAPALAPAAAAPPSAPAPAAPVARAESAEVADARRAQANSILEELLGREVVSLLDGREYEAALSGVASCFRAERTKTGRPRWSCDRSEALDQALRALNLGALTSEPFQLVSNRFGGSDEGALAAAACTDMLQRFHLRAVSGTAPLVVTLSGRLVFSPFRNETHSQLYAGQLRCQAVRVRVYHRPSNEVLLNSPLNSDENLREGEAFGAALPQPWVARDSSQSEVAERYAVLIGQRAGVRAAQGLIADFLRARSGVVNRTPEVDAAQAEGPRHDEGFSGYESFADGAGRSELSAEAGPSPEISSAPAARYVLCFRGLHDADVDDALERLTRAEGFARWKHVSSVGDLRVYSCTFEGRGVVLRLRDSLAADGISATVSKRGPRLTITLPE